MNIDKALVILVVCFIAFILVDHLMKIINRRKKLSEKKVSQGNESIKDSIGQMVEYSRETSQKYGFNIREGFKRPSVLRRKGMTEEEEAQLDKIKYKNEKFSNAMKNYISLRDMVSCEKVSNKTIRVYIDTVNDTKVLARDNTAFLELDLGQVYDMAGEFVLININKEGERFNVNYVLIDD